MRENETAWDDPEFVRAWNETYGMDMRNAPIRGRCVFPWIKSEIGNAHGKRLLDIGCGNGNLVNYFREAALAEIVGVDHGAAVVESARKSVDDPRVKFVHASVTKSFPIAETGRNFDVVTSVFVIEEVPMPHFDSYCQTFYNTMKNGGKALVFVNHPVNAMIQDLHAQETGQSNDKFPEHEGYFDRNPTLYTLEVMNRQEGVPKRAEYHHKTVADILNAFARANLVFSSMIEVPKGIVDFEAIKDYSPRSGDIPRFVGFVFEKK